MYMLGVIIKFKKETKGGDCYRAALHGFTICSSAFTKGGSFKTI